MNTLRKIGDVVLSAENISLSFGGVKALTNISLDVREHEICAIIGPNGAGKSSMLNVINGVSGWLLPAPCLSIRAACR